MWSAETLKIAEEGLRLTGWWWLEFGGWMISVYLGYVGEERRTNGGRGKNRGV